MTGAIRFSDAWLRKLTPASKGKRLQYTDADCRGLILRVNEVGGRQFLVRYSVRGRGQKMMTLEPYPAISLADAREKAREARRMGKEGIDVKAEREKRIEERISESERTFTVLFGGDDDEKDVSKWENEFWSWKAGRVRREETVRTLRNMFRRMFLCSEWADVAISDIDTADLYAWLDWCRENSSSETAIRKVAGVLRDMYKWSIRKRLYRGVPPSVKEVWEVGIKSGKRTRFLTPDELRAVWSATEKMGYPRGSFYRFMLLTGQRLRQTLWIEWSDIDGDNVWHAWADNTKSGEEKLVPLSRQALTLLKSIRPKDGEKRRYVFAKTDGGEPFVTHKVKHYELYEATRRAKDDPTHPDGGWTPHDFRRTQRTRLAQMSGPHAIKSHVADMLAGRQGDEKAGVSGIYNQYDYLVEMREAAQAWADWLEAVVSDDETVVPLEAAR